MSVGISHTQMGEGGEAMRCFNLFTIGQDPVIVLVVVL
jgi:hypothetical protein